MDSFGARFGILVKTRRGIEGLSQRDLAIRAFDDEARKTRISELENGKVPNPQQRTIDALVTALNIPAEDVAACRTPDANGPSPEIHDELAAGLLENLSMRFGHDNPDATRTELRAFLQEKARDYRALKERLDEIEQAAESEGRLDNQLTAAQAAIDAGDFDEADDILASAEEIQQAERTLAQVRHQSRIRATRGDAALLKGDPDTAYAHYAAAAGFFDPFDPEEGGRTRIGYVSRLIEHGERFADAAMRRAVDLARQNTTAFSRRENPDDWAMAHGSLGNALTRLGARESGTARLEEAVAAYRAALAEYTRDRVPLDWAMTQNNLGNALRTLGERESGTARLEEAVAAYCNALAEITRNRMSLGWAMVRMNIAKALMLLGERKSDGTVLTAALAAMQDARTVHVDEAGMAHVAEELDGYIAEIEALIANLKG